MRSLMLWDMVMMAVVWVLWYEKNNRIFDYKASSTYELIDSIYILWIFQAGHLSLPLKRKVDMTVLTYARKKCRDSTVGLCTGDSSQSDALVPVDGGHILLGQSDWRNADLKFSGLLFGSSYGGC